MLEKQQKHIRRHKRVRTKISGTAKVPRLSVFRSNRNIYAQIIDDEKGRTFVSASDKELKKSQISNLKSQKNSKSKIQKDKTKIRTGKILIAYEVGRLVAEKALGKKIKKVVFDRSGYKYHGRIKALAEGAREGGLNF